MLNKGSAARNITMSGCAYMKMNALVYKCVLYLPCWYWASLLWQLWSVNAFLPVLSSRRGWVQLLWFCCQGCPEAFPILLLAIWLPDEDLFHLEENSHLECHFLPNGLVLCRGKKRYLGYLVLENPIFKPVSGFEFFHSNDIKISLVLITLPISVPHS